ncbi:hypothetical protein BUALT_Bualt05G0031500 [Buddleja alternifolia]|uniref:Aminotransferase-like plant mobile domain-containing protein n=1 Tax=Buddleja alternifolia TaxID=168488 RepID=A0AAV6XSL2_9LAMI|nr:hypothetical protein BUALT_Bualt05G0031500 [Buddleja alternifolia]
MVKALSKISERRGLTQEELDCCTRALVLLLIGTNILCTKGVSPIYLELLKDIDQIRDYAWGIALLACVKVGLQRKKSHISYNAHFFTAFMIEHCHVIGRTLFPGQEFHTDNLPMEFSLQRGLYERLRHRAKINYNQKNREEFMEALRSITEADIMVIHDPSLSSTSFLVENEFSGHKDALSNVHSSRKKSRQGAKQDWTTVHVFFIAAWENLNQNDGNELDMLEQMNPQPIEETERAANRTHSSPAHEGEHDMLESSQLDPQHMDEVERINVLIFLHLMY